MVKTCITPNFACPEFQVDLCRIMLCSEDTLAEMGHESPLEIHSHVPTLGFRLRLQAGDPVFGGLEIAGGDVAVELDGDGV